MAKTGEGDYGDDNPRKVTERSKGEGMEKKTERQAAQPGQGKGEKHEEPQEPEQMQTESAEETDLEREEQPDAEKAPQY